MKITIHLPADMSPTGMSIEAVGVVDPLNPRQVLVPGYNCGCSLDEVLAVAGVCGTTKSERTDSHTTVTTGDVGCARCRGVLGTIEVVQESLFGHKEDDAMLVTGRPRVY